MRTWLVPVVWIGFAAIHVIPNVLLLRVDLAQRLASRSDWEQQRLRTVAERRWPLVVSACVAAFCSLRALQAAVDYQPEQWLWVLAGVAWLLAVWTSRLARGRARGVLRDLPVPEPTEQERVRARYVRFYAALSLGSFLASQLTMRWGVAQDLDAVKVLAGALLLVAFVAGFCLVGAGTWLFRAAR